MVNPKDKSIVMMYGDAGAAILLKKLAEMLFPLLFCVVMVLDLKLLFYLQVDFGI